MTLVKHTVFSGHLNAFAFLLVIPLLICSCSVYVSNNHDSQNEWEYVITLDKTDEAVFYEEIDSAIRMITQPDNLYSDFQKNYYSNVYEFYSINFTNNNYDSKLIYWYNRDILLENESESQAKLSVSYSELK